MIAELIAHELGVSPSAIHLVARSASHRYKVYAIPKRNGGDRVIHHPARELKAIQRWILHHVLGSFAPHDAATAYRPGSSTRLNALRHVESRYFLRMDLKDFFPSIHADDVRAALECRRPLLGDWSEDDVALVVAICCRFGRLTIGAPTSPALANLVCYELDERLSSIAAARNVIYSRYADDLFFSTPYRGVLPELETLVPLAIASTTLPKNLTLNEGKTRRWSAKHRVTLTGVVLATQGVPSVGRDAKRLLRATLWNLEQLGPQQRRTFAGKLAYAFSVEPDLRERLSRRYGADRVDAALRPMRSIEIDTEGV